MSFLFLLVRFYPVWVFALGIVLVQLGMFFRHRASVIQYYFWIPLGISVVTVILWIVYRGDLHSDEWVRAFLRDFWE
ncbi:MAG: hypothetical protein AABZ55_11895 [Bdellovibrionota bacterium]